MLSQALSERHRKWSAFTASPEQLEERLPEIDFPWLSRLTARPGSLCAGEFC